MLNLFGTDGIRGPFGTGLLVHEKLHAMGKALALWALKRYQHNPRILIIHDTRNSCALIKAYLKGGLLQYPVSIFDGSILPTPAAAHFMRDNMLDCAVIISASHNVYSDNGIKIIDNKAGKLSLDDELFISSLIVEQLGAIDVYGECGRDTMFDAQSRYIEQLVRYFSAAFLKNKKIVIDCAHGATFKVAPAIFSALGADIVVINDTPDGYNINKNCGALVLQSLQQTVVATSADIGFAFDGDGDRVIAVNNKGCIKNGDDILALLLTHSRYNTQTTIVGTLMTNCGLEQKLIQSNKVLLRTSVGDKFVLQEMQQRGLIIGGEQSGHIILSDVVSTGDGILVALTVLEALVATDNWDMNSFEPYPQVLLNIPAPRTVALTDACIVDYIAAAQQEIGNGRLIVRFSGTEPVLRIMVEASHYDTAYAVAHNLADKLTPFLV
ncbi:MAG: hypothetical protein WC707_00245 [Candidatus Babeliaceae bacterium]|jgi:phosphoglucosamine mutase